MHGYKLQDKFPEFLDGEAEVVSDYRETLGDMLLHNFTEQWADYHKWTARNSVNDTDADNQCCQQTYIDRYVQTSGKKDLSQVKANLDHQIKCQREDGYWNVSLVCPSNYGGPEMTGTDCLLLGAAEYYKLLKVKK